MTGLSEFLPGLALAFTALLFGLLSPGPRVLAILGTALGQGRAPALALAVGVGLGTTSWAFLTVAGLSALIAVSAKALFAIKIAGGCYLLWLALKSFRAAVSDQDMSVRVRSGGASTLGACFVQGWLIHMTNPKAAFVWLSIAAIALQADAPIWVGAILVGGACALSCTVNTIYALAFTTEPVFALYRRARRTIQASLGAFFAFLGIGMLTNRLG